MMTIQHVMLYVIDTIDRMWPACSDLSSFERARVQIGFLFPGRDLCALKESGTVYGLFLPRLKV